ncbi:Hypothetical protein CINCED_3A020254 [Cinara cedri]|uniref:Uncharacterized protein n=1 Tax=Cinara cedri TaxID=506608 RepID=A0A5E4NTE8_9HEMI|nr:Hypothetical protein CINCED_3A020254 [Cinara cedri]
MCQRRLNGLAILSMEKEAAKRVDFDAIIKEFAEAKVRRQKMNGLFENYFTAYSNRNIISM